MTTYVTDQMNSNTICFRFTVPHIEYEAALDALYRANKSQYAIPGVRKGKADRKMLEAYLGRNAFTKPAVDKFVSEAYFKAASEYPEEIYYMPSITIEQNKAGCDLVFSARVQINPETKLGHYRAVKLTEDDYKTAEGAVHDVPESDRDSTRLYLLQSTLIGRIADESTLEIPETMINERVMNMMREFERRLKTNHESLESYYKGSGSNEEMMLKEFSTAARKQLRERLTLLAIAKAEGLEASDKEYDAEIHRLSAMYLMPPEQLKALFTIREGSKLKQDIAIAKAADFIGQMIQEQPTTACCADCGNGNHDRK